MSDGNLKAQAIRAAVELHNRKIDSLMLFRPLPHQEDALRRLTLDSVVEALIGGGNRSGKSTFIAAVMSSLLRDKPITLSNGDQIHVRPERWRGKELLVWGVGYDWNHIGETMYQLLFRPGQFDIIRDDKTNEWRAYNPITDRDRSHLKRGAPPFLPHSSIDPKSWSFENKKAKQLRSIQMKDDNSRLVFYPSTAEVAQGQPVHWIWLDEDIENTDHYSEWLMRISQYSGKITWTSWPTNVPSALMAAIQERGIEQQEDEAPRTLYFQFKGSSNPHVQTKHRDYALSTMTDEEREARDSGVMNRESWLMYPRFSRRIHSVIQGDADTDDKLASAVRNANGIPEGFTRYLILDPGTSNPAVLFAAVPPPSYGDFVVPYDEIYIPRLDADQLAQKVLEKTKGQFFQAFIVDGHAYRQTPMGLNFSIGDNYSRAFAAKGLRCVESGSAFTPGSDVPEVRIGQLQSWLPIRSTGTPKLRIFGCPALVKQLESYMKAAGPDRQPTDKPSKRQKIDVAVCLEYLASRNPRYVPPPSEQPVSPGMARWNAFVKMFSGDNGEKVRCGPGIASKN